MVCETNEEIMFFKFFFTKMSIHKQVEYLKKKGIMLGTRCKEGRKIYIYMLTNLFVEVVFRNDNTEDTPERTKTLSGLKSLNDYLEKEFKASF